MYKLLHYKYLVSSKNSLKIWSLFLITYSFI